MSTSEDYQTTNLVMDPGSEDPQAIPVKRRSSSFKHVEYRHWQIGETSDDEEPHIDEIGEDPDWMLATRVAASPDELMQAAEKQGVALQTVHFRRPDIKVLIRIPNTVYDRGDVDCFVRYTTDGWQTYNDAKARHCSDCLGMMPSTQLFRTRIPLPENEHGRLEFAICMRSGGEEVWDNNFGANHVVQPIENRSI
ncbi:hypothetical protein, variant [Salpingoeca rosetta]|nr:hypothetical protein, variant [Salpingoeca rosetta]EGD76192.1 hypothetical protein, variant [Salpingoeca rosetta]|eukprot:XP_004998367.1 hypothetical protein, variant [Salpingoeca rosetta]